MNSSPRNLWLLVGCIVFLLLLAVGVWAIYEWSWIAFSLLEGHR